MKKVLITFLILLSVSIYSLDIQILEPTKVYIKQSTSSTVIHKLNVGLNIKASTDPSNNEWLRVSFNKGGDSYSGWILASKTDYIDRKTDYIDRKTNREIDREIQILIMSSYNGSYSAIIQIQEWKELLKKHGAVLYERIDIGSVYSRMLEAYVEAASYYIYEKKRYDDFIIAFEEALNYCIAYSEVKSVESNIKQKVIKKTLSFYLIESKKLKDSINEEQIEILRPTYRKAYAILVDK